jgi:dihydropteroate synthase
METSEHVCFVTGRLAAPAVQAVADELTARLGFAPTVYVAKISVAALMTVEWLARSFRPPVESARVILPGACLGDLDVLRRAHPRATFERGPVDLLDLPAYLDPARGGEVDYGGYDLEILSEINHANRLEPQELLEKARRLRAAGADVVDLGCTPGERWSGVADAVRRLRDDGLRVSIDTFDRWEVGEAVRGGAELVLSVHRDNVDAARDWGVEVVAIPERPDEAGWLDELLAVVERLEADGVPHRVDPVLSPIGFGFARSLGRYLRWREAAPRTRMLMGVGNLTELTSVDSAGVNAILVGFCQELGIQSVLTTEVANWARSSTAEIDVARRLMHFAVSKKRLPKHVDARLVQLRDERVVERGPQELRRLHEAVRDRNFRIFAERGRIHAFNADRFESDADAFQLFERLAVDDPSHAFYLGWEMMKAALALTLGKTYIQDRALRWGLASGDEAIPPAGGGDGAPDTRKGPGGRC